MESYLVQRSYRKENNHGFHKSIIVIFLLFINLTSVFSTPDIIQPASVKEKCNNGNSPCNSSLKCVNGICISEEEIRWKCNNGNRRCHSSMKCVEKTCQCREETDYYVPFLGRCKSGEYTDVTIQLSGHTVPLMLMYGDEIQVICNFTLVHDEKLVDVGWYFKGKRIYTKSSNVFDSTFVKQDCHQWNRSSVIKECHYQSLLRIQKFKKSYIGNYACKAEWSQKRRERVGKVTISENMFIVPYVRLTPINLQVKRGSNVTVKCHGKHIDTMSFYLDHVAVKNITVDFRAKEGKKSYTFVALRGQVWCSGIKRGYQRNKEVKSNFVQITIVSKGEKTCSKDVDHRGIQWGRTKSPSTVQGDCPEGYIGYSNRHCKANGKWKKAIYSTCLRVDLEELEEEIADAVTEKPSKEMVEDISNKLSESMSTSKHSMISDIPKVVSILSDVSDMITSNDQESDESLVTQQALDSVANLTDELLSFEPNEWADLYEPGNNNTKPDVVVARLMVAMDNYATSSLKDSTFSSKPIVRDKVVIKLGQLDSSRNVKFPDKSDSENPSFDEWIGDSDNSIFLPSSAIPDTAENVRYSVLMYKGIEQIMSSGYPIGKRLKEKKIQSKIMTFSLNKRIQRLSSELQLTFNVPKDNVSEPLCVFLDTSASEEVKWSTEGCKTQKLRDGLIKCTCNHFTNFAVLTGFGNMNEAHREALSVLTKIGCSISIVCLVALIATYIILWGYMKKDRKTYLHLSLSVCLLITYVIFLAGVDRSNDEPSCTIVASLLHYFLLTVFCLMLCEAVEILMAVFYVFTYSLPLWKLLLPAFGFPAIIVCITLGATEADGYHDDISCWLKVSNGVIWTFGVPAMTVLLINFIVLGITLYIIMHSMSVKQKDNFDKAKLTLRSIAVLAPVLGFTWLFGILSIDTDVIAFQYVFIISNALQGASIFIVYCVMFNQVRDAIKLFRSRERSKSIYSRTTSLSSTRKLSSSQGGTKDNGYLRKQPQTTVSYDNRYPDALSSDYDQATALDDEHNIFTINGPNP